MAILDKMAETMKNDTLYKYRSWKREFHPDSLISNQLYFSSPKAMNDPFDFKIPPNFSLLDTDEQIDKYIGVGLSKFTREQIDLMGGIEKFRRLYFDKFKTEVAQAQKDYENNFFPTIDKHFGVLCFSRLWNNVLMWSHYSDNHSGFCLGFSKKKLEQEIKSGSLGRVWYNKFPNISPLESDTLNTAIIQSYFKAPGWRYEREFRFIRLEYPEELTRNMRIHTYHDQSLKEIILGLVIDEEEKGKIIKIGLEKNVPIYQVEKIQLSFKITRRKLTDDELNKYI